VLEFWARETNEFHGDKYFFEKGGLDMPFENHSGLLEHRNKEKSP